MSAWLAIVFLLVAALVMLLSPEAGAVIGLSNESVVQLIRVLAILVFLGGTVTVFYRGQISLLFKHVVTWAATFVALIGIYTYRAELATVGDRVMSELRPEGSQINVYGADKTVRIKRGWSGHFIAQTVITGTNIEMIVDTGASTVVLRHEDAKRLGFDMKKLSYTVPVQTANGSSFAARVRLADVFVGDVGLGNVEALVAKPGSLHQSLLGMSFLSRLHSYEFSGNQLVMRS